MRIVYNDHAKHWLIPFFHNEDWKTLNITIRPIIVKVHSTKIEIIKSGNYGVDNDVN